MSFYAVSLSANVAVTLRLSRLQLLRTIPHRSCPKTNKKPCVKSVYGIFKPRAQTDPFIGKFGRIQHLFTLVQPLLIIIQRKSCIFDTLCLQWLHLEIFGDFFGSTLPRGWEPIVWYKYGVQHVIWIQLVSSNHTNKLISQNGHFFSRKNQNIDIKSIYE